MADTQVSPAVESSELPKAQSSDKLAKSDKLDSSDAPKATTTNTDTVDAVNNDEADVKSLDKSLDQESAKEAESKDEKSRSHAHSGARNGRGRGNFQQRRNGRNNEFADLPPSDDPVEIRAQVEFYFSNQNLATDTHLFEQLEGPKNRPVSIKHIQSFKRMRHFQPYSAIVAALRESKHLIVLDDGEYAGTGNESIKRSEPLVVEADPKDEKNPPSIQDLYYRFKSASSNLIETSIYVKGFGSEKQAGQIALEQFFRPYGSVMVRKRRENNGDWKGSVFVEFDSEQSQKQFLALDPKPKFNEQDLTCMGKKEYVEMKCKEKGIKPDWELTEKEKHEQRAKLRASNEDGRGGYRGRGRDRGRGGRGGRGNHDRRSNGRDHRDRNRSHSPRGRRDRSGSAGSVDSRDWNTRRDRYQKGKKDNNRDSNSNGKRNNTDVTRDAYGVPVVRDTRTDAEKAADAGAATAKKRKAGEAGEDGADHSPKKSKLDIVVD